MRFSALPGFRDVFPEVFARRRRIFGVWRDVATRYGFEEYDGPPLEPLELYTQKSGDEIVGQLYTFTDKGDRKVALRPEMTPTFARMVAERASQLKKPIRWFTIPQLFRYERQQRGRLREHFQLNVDIAGEPGPAADAEVIAVAVEIMRALGLGPADVRVRLSDRRILAGALTTQHGVKDGEVPAVLAALDRWEKSRDATEAALLETFGGDAARTKRVMDFAAGLGEPAGLLESEAAAPLRECLDQLGALGLRDYADVDLRIVRGLAYYTGIVFELFDAGKSLRAICGGGRYDDLLKQLGGADLPCVGFGMGDVVLGELLAEREGKAASAAAAVDVFVATATPEDRPAALALAQALRAAGHRVEYPLGKQALRKQFELANARLARWCVVVGPDERAAGVAVVKDLRDGTERRVALEALRRGDLGGGPGSGEGTAL
jgi:histidyl-tRNA synthetase